MNKSTLKSYLYIFISIIMFMIGIQLQASGFIDALYGYQDDIIYLTKQHLSLVGISASIAIILAIPLGVILSRPRFAKTAETFMQGLNIGTTVPTLAILTLAMSFLGIGTVPAIFGLTLASLLPIVRNTYTGLKEVPTHLKEAASGIGMTPMQMLLKVEIPNASLVIFAGIRTALAINVGTAPLAFLIGGGGLGDLIFTGIKLDDTYMMLAGALPTSLSAVAIDIFIALLMVILIPKGINPLRNKS